MFILGLEFNRIGAIGIGQILQALRGSKNFEKLYLNQNDIKKEVGEAFIQFLPQIENLKELRIDNNKL